MAFEEIVIALGRVRSGIPDKVKRQTLKYVRDEAETMRQDFGIELRKMADGQKVFPTKNIQRSGSNR
ncbi:MAG: hypothetical protein ACYCVG_12225 [Leptospirillum sp.]|jgi:hypothetical protein